MPGYETIGEEERREVLEILSKKVLFRYEFHSERGGVYKVEQFEEEFARYCGTRFALAVSSGTAALKVALASLGIGPGDEVVTQGFTFVATWEAILDMGAIPVFSEIDETLCMDPDDLEKRISPNTKVIMPVHMCGAQARIDKIMEIAKRHNLYVIEDTAQACGGRFRGKTLGSFGDVGTFSFDSVKTITTGEGGMLITDDESLYIKASQYHDHGHDHNPELPRGLEGRDFIGFNFRMMELQGAIGIAQLRKLDSIILKRQRKNKKIIKELLSGKDLIRFRHIPDPEGDTATFLSIFIDNEDELKRFKDIMGSFNIPIIYWGENLWHNFSHWEHLHGQKSIQRYGYPFKDRDGSLRMRYHSDELPKTSEILSRCISIPISIYMDETIEKIREAVTRL